MNANLEPCIDVDTLAAFAEGKLARRDMPAVLAHLDSCPRCFAALDAANESLAAEAGSRFHPRWAAIAAVIVLAVVAIPFMMRGRGSRSGMATLVALAPQDARPVEPRLSGGFAWAPYRGPMRAGESATNAQKLKLSGAAGDAVERADREPTADAQRTAGVALVLIDQPLDAVNRLRDAATRAPNDAHVWSDLAAAQAAAAIRTDRASLYPEALAWADHALRLDPQLAEALFNRALVLEKLGLRQQAYDAWQRYLRVDASSPWAVEANEHAKKLAPATGEQLFKQELPRLERAAAAGDEKTLVQIVDRYREQSRAFAEAEYLGRWSSAEKGGDAAEAARMLAVARSIGDALVKLSGESLAREAVRAIDESNGERRKTIAEAHEVYRRGRIAYSKHALLDAEPDLRQAAALFEKANDPMAFMARYYAAQVRFDRNDVAGARGELESLRGSLTNETRFAAAGALVQWELALCAMVDADWSSAVERITEAQSAFRRLGERSNLGFVETLLADDLTSLGRADDAWAARIRSFALLSSEGRGDRLPVALGCAARMELRAARFDEARAMLQLEETADRAADAPVLLSNALVREAALSAAMNDDAGAQRYAREAAETAGRVPDGSLRERALIDAAFAEGAASLRSDPRRARESLGRAADGYRARELAFFLPETQLLRARADVRIGDRDAAAHDFDAGIEALENHRIEFASGVVGTGVFDAGAALFHDAMALSLDRGDVPAAFAYAERSRAQVGAGKAIGAAELQRRLRGSDAAVLQLVVRPSEVVAFTITEKELKAARQPLTSEIDESLSDSALFDLLIRPSQQFLATAKELIVVPDRQLDGVSFAALVDSANGQRLIERMPVSIAASASSLERQMRPLARESVVAVALPSGSVDRTVALPASEEELTDVAAIYRRAVSIASDRATFDAVSKAASSADVLHIAGHTQRQRGEPELMFAGERVSWRAIAASRLERHPVVILAACETLRALPARAAAFSLGDGFIAAGAGDVIGTLAPVMDADARAMFRIVHQQLAAGATAAEAVRRVQLQGIAEESAQHRRGAWRSIALLTSRIPNA